MEKQMEESRAIRAATEDAYFCSLREDEEKDRIAAKQRKNADPEVRRRKIAASWAERFPPD